MQPGLLALDDASVAGEEALALERHAQFRIGLDERPGDGKTWFNGRTLEDYFPRATHRTLALAPLKTAGVEGTFDVRVRVHGGGPSGQAGAVRHGIARALVEADPELRVPLKRAGFLTRDARIVERKKAGLHKARKAPQFSKR